MAADLTTAEVLVWAEKVARSWGARYYVDWREVLGAAWQGVRKAAARWDPERATCARAAYLVSYGKLAIIDDLRAHGQMTRSQRRSGIWRMSLDAPVKGDGGATWADFLPSYAAGPAATALERDYAAAVWEAVAGVLAPIDALVLEAYYVDGLNMREIAELLGVTESRICQRRKRALADLAECCPDLGR